MDAILVGMVLMFGGGPDESTAPKRVATIDVVQNVTTKHRAILDTLGIFPGQKMPSEADLLRAEIRLLMKFHKRFDLDGGKRPRVKIVRGEKESEYFDLVVIFPERR